LLFSFNECNQILKILLKDIGSVSNFQTRVETFMQYPDEVKKKANAKLLIPFFILLAGILGLSIAQL